MRPHKMGIRGMVRVVVYGPDGNIARHEPTKLQKLFGLPGSLKISENHNIVTDIGDALIADLFQQTPERTKPDNTNAVIGVGTGFATELKTTNALVTQVGAYEAMDALFPYTKGDWGAANDNVVIWESTFEAGDVTTAVALDEAHLTNGTDTLAYAEITAPVTVGALDTLKVTWEITFLGA